MSDLQTVSALERVVHVKTLQQLNLIIIIIITSSPLMSVIAAPHQHQHASNACCQAAFISLVISG